MSYQSFSTTALPQSARALVIRPPSYDRDRSRRYPLLIFLHDGYGDERALETHGVAAELLARMTDGRLPEFFVVAPGAPASWFSDYYDGSRRYEQFLARDLLPSIESRYRILPGREARGITGISMGGFGAFKIALKNPTLFGSVSSLSGALIPLGWEDLERYSWFARWTLKRVFGKTRDANSLAENDVWRLLWNSHFDSPPFAAHLRAGTSDVYRLDRVAAQYGSVLNEQGIPATVVLEPGGHDWSYWRRGLLAIAGWHAHRFEYDAKR